MVVEAGLLMGCKAFGQPKVLSYEAPHALTLLSCFPVNQLSAMCSKGMAGPIIYIGTKAAFCAAAQLAIFKGIGADGFS